mmetsp:Transcript_42363/g.99479  ORF Transcript_42363/g.99479 Transcript_42363/m.99479 type:complete len:304 (+) Transcript_42363:22-933(+)
MPTHAHATNSMSHSSPASESRGAATRACESRTALDISIPADPKLAGARVHFLPSPSDEPKPEPAPGSEGEAWWASPAPRASCARSESERSDPSAEPQVRMAASLSALSPRAHSAKELVAPASGMLGEVTGLKLARAARVGADKELHDVSVDEPPRAVGESAPEVPEVRGSRVLPSARASPTIMMPGGDSDLPSRSCADGAWGAGWMVPVERREKTESCECVRGNAPVGGRERPTDSDGGMEPEPEPGMMSPGEIGVQGCVKELEPSSAGSASVRRTHSLRMRRSTARRSGKTGTRQKSARITG